MRKLDRRNVLRSGAGFLAATTAMLHAGPAAATVDASSAIAEARRLVSEVIAADIEMAEAERAKDSAREGLALERYNAAFENIGNFADELRQTPPRTWVDIIALAELAGCLHLWDKSRGNWDDLQAGIDGIFDYEERTNAALAVAVLYLADREGGQGHG